MRCGLRVKLRFLFGFLLLPFAASAEQSPAPIALSWSAPDECPSRDRVIRQLETVLSHSDRARAPVMARASITREPTGFRLQMWIGSEEPLLQRTLYATSCVDLADAAALILALQIDPETSASPELEELASPPPTAASAQKSLAPAGDSKPERPVSSGPRGAPTGPEDASPAAPQVSALATSWGLLAGPSVEFGALPYAAPGLALGAQVQVERLTFALIGSWFPHSQREVAPAEAGQPAKGGTFSLALGAFRTCYELLDGATLAACADVEFGVLGAHGYGTRTDSERKVLWAALGPGLEAGLPVSSRLEVRAALDGHFSLQRPEFVLENVDSIYRPRAATLRLSLGLLLRFP